MCIPLSILGLIYSSMVAIRQTDLKRIIAYASIAHMNLIMIGLYTNKIYGLEGHYYKCLVMD